MQADSVSTLIYNVVENCEQFAQNNIVQSGYALCVFKYSYGLLNFLACNPTADTAVYCTCIYSLLYKAI